MAEERKPKPLHEAVGGKHYKSVEAYLKATTIEGKKRHIEALELLKLEAAKMRKRKR